MPQITIRLADYKVNTKVSPLAQFKQIAHAVKKEHDITHNEALNVVARAMGFESYYWARQRLIEAEEVHKCK